MPNTPPVKPGRPAAGREFDAGHAHPARGLDGCVRAEHGEIAQHDGLMAADHRPPADRDQRPGPRRCSGRARVAAVDQVAARNAAQREAVQIERRVALENDAVRGTRVTCDRAFVCVTVGPAAPGRIGDAAPAARRAARACRHSPAAIVIPQRLTSRAAAADAPTPSTRDGGASARLLTVLLWPELPPSAMVVQRSESAGRREQDAVGSRLRVGG